MTPAAAAPAPPREVVPEVVHDLTMRSCTPETGTYRRRNVVQGLSSWRQLRADVRRQRLVDAQLQPQPDVTDPAPRSPAARARGLWCGFLSGLG